MSAFAVRVTSDKQTLILAGEAIPPPRTDMGRAGAGRADAGSQLQRVTMVVVQGEYAAAPRTVVADSGTAKSPEAADGESVLLSSAAAVDMPAVPANFIVPSPASSRGLSTGAAQYARTQNISGGRARSQLIDTYA
jgi:hypothetical protein